MSIPGLSDGPAAPETDAPGPSVIPPKDHDGPPTFVVVKTASCQWCQKAMDFLEALHKERGDFQVAVLDAGEQPDAFRQITQQTRRQTVPQIFLDGGFVGGWDDLAAAAKKGQLDAYLDGRAAKSK